MLMWSFRNIFLGLERFRGSTSTKRNHKTMVSQMDTIKKDAKSLKLYYVMKYVTYKLKEGMKLIFVNLRWKTKSCTGNVAPEWWYFCLDICHSFSTLSQYSLKNFPDFKKRHFLQPVFNEIQQISPRSWRLVTSCSQKMMKNATSTEDFSCDM